MRDRAMLDLRFSRSWLYANLYIGRLVDSSPRPYVDRGLPARPHPRAFTLERFGRRGAALTVVPWRGFGLLAFVKLPRAERAS